MSYNNNIFQERAWMYRRLDTLNNGVSEEFLNGLESFLNFAQEQPSYKNWGNMLCPCLKCLNRKRFDVNTVGNHLFEKGFMDFYFIWTSHGELCGYTGEASTSNIDDHVDETDENSPRENMIHDEFHEPYLASDENVFEEPCEDASIFFKRLEAAQQPIYEGCVEGLSGLSLSTRLMTIKTDHNLPEVCMNAICEAFTDYLPANNIAPKSYYEMKKLTRSLGLPMHKIDVCEDNCMLFWKGDEKLLKCRFCGKDRYKPKPEGGGGGKNIPNQRMFYMPIGDRLKRLYQSERTASYMRWHAEHLSPEGEMHHPSDGEAWKHFHKVYPRFALERRNVYLALSTDGFNPGGMHSRDHSVWPVIVTPYNLPPDMCMKKENLFLSILVPGPKHPKKSLDIYLQPLIEELKDLWTNGIEAYDVSKKQNFVMRAVLMWTISDFPAYGMLAGWMTHGRLACPCCLDETQSFWLKHGRKHSWFDCHRRFLPQDHPYRRNVRSFKKNKSVRELPPLTLNGEEVLYERINQIQGVLSSVDCGGNGHIPCNISGYGDYHNWIKKSIFWELPYWENQLLRHNLDVMHIEKNVFDNIMNTVLNVPGKTKDNLKTRLDLPTVCNRKGLEVTEDGKLPFPIFRLPNEARKIFLRWLKRDIRFPDGYVADISACVDEESWRLVKLKSHDCHVIMQRLLPIAFSELLPRDVHKAIADIALFFRDLCGKTLKTSDVEVMKANIATKICNLEKVFPPSFFDVMEHLPVHLPDEAALGGPVQFRWMYPFERYMRHLKMKAKNKAKIGGSIVAQCITEEISHFSSYYFAADGRNSHHNRTTDSEIQFTYNYPSVPSMFQSIGRVSGKSKEAWLTEEDAHILHTFLLLNCEEIEPYERLFEKYMYVQQPGITYRGLVLAKETHFASWIRDHINDLEHKDQGNCAPLWLLEFVQGPKLHYTLWPIFFSRGYKFHTFDHGQHKKTMNYGVCVRGSIDSEFYGLINEIFMIEYHGAVALKTMVFRCSWFDQTIGQGMRRHPSGIVDICPKKHYQKYDPFITTDQADQVCYIPYPRMKQRSEEWWVCAKVIPRGVRSVSPQIVEPALQDDNYNHNVVPVDLLDVTEHTVDGENDDDMELDDPTIEEPTIEDHYEASNDGSYADSE